MNMAQQDTASWNEIKTKIFNLDLPEPAKRYTTAERLQRKEWTLRVILISKFLRDSLNTEATDEQVYEFIDEHSDIDKLVEFLKQAVGETQLNSLKEHIANDLRRKGM